jgi:uncharacterized membrane protein
MMKKISLYVMVVLYIAAGVNHFVHPVFYLQIMPPYVPWHHALVMISGICEIVFALLLLPGSTRRWGAWCIILLLVAVFPANIQMAINYARESNPGLWLSILRLPLQFLLIGWAYSFTGRDKAL